MNDLYYIHLGEMRNYWQESIKLIKYYNSCAKLLFLLNAAILHKFL